MLHNLATTYPQRRPSDFLGLDDPWEAFQLDVTVLDAAMKAANGQSQRAPKGQKRPAAGAANGKFMSAQNFANLMGVKIRRMKVPESGVW